jgi:hypothetical protein
MKIYLTDQSKRFPEHLDFFKQKPIIKYNKPNLKEKTTIITVDMVNDFARLDTSFLWEYKIFPAKILTFLSQWTYENREMRIGDTIVQQAFIPPIRQFSQKIIFGVRINNIIREPTKIGFSYETLSGHVEMGVSEFTIELTEEKRTIFKIHTFSKPGNYLTKLFGPIFSVPYQTYCTRQGLMNVKRQLESDR